MASGEPEGKRFAQVTFRVRCEKVGHGESVFLSPVGNNTGSRVSAIDNCNCIMPLQLRKFSPLFARCDVRCTSCVKCIS